MNTEAKMGFAAVALFFVVMVAAAYGYIHNIVILLSDATVSLTVQVVIRICGIFVPPLGVLMGYL
jgi:hypothetical protein